MAQQKSKSKSGSTSRKKNTGSTAKKGNTARRKNTSTGTKKAAATTKKNTAAPKNQPAVKDTSREDRFYHELIWVGLLLFCLVLFLGDIDKAGGFGHVLKEIQFGLFGTTAYIFPFFLFILFLAIYVGGGEAGIMPAGKIGIGVLLFLCLCGLVGLIGGQGGMGGRSLGDFYRGGMEGINGGLIGGILCVNLVGLLGTIMSCLILILAIVLCVILLLGRGIFASMYYRRQRIRKRAKAKAEHARQMEEIRRKEWELAQEEEEFLRQQEELEFLRQQENMEARRTEFRARSLTFGEETKLEPVLPEVEVPEVQILPEEAAQDRDVVPVEMEEEAPVFSGTIHGADLYNDNKEDVVDTSDWLSALEDAPITGEVPEIIPEESIPADIYEEIPPEEDIYEGDIDKEDIYEEEPSHSMHPAAQEFSEEESMAAYDEFDDAPIPESIWRSGDKQEGNSGARFSDLTVKEEEKPVIKKDYQFPAMELLSEPSRKGGMSEEQLRATAGKLQQTLRNFGVGVTVTEISCGPAVTRYELQPDQGVKVSRIVGLADDIKLNLAAADIRIEAPIPGKAAVGIEVPNEKKQTVTLRELLDSEEFRRNASKVSFGVGKDIAGKVIVADLARMPHLLIAGATGSGKSVCINSIIVSILYKAHPDDVKLILIDPKVVELSVYNGIPHLMIPVVTDPKKAAAALNWAVVEMNDRYKKFADMGCRDIKSYNRKVEASEDPDLVKLPQIIVIVDELADLMMVAAGEVEEAICRLAQLARAAGIHLVLATQRPSVDVITGLIKANVPSRIAFAVSSATDSRTIIDMGGAEKLLGYGDMMFYPAGYPKPVRVQGAFVSDEEVSNVVDALTSQGYGLPMAGRAIEKQLDQMKDAGTVGAGARDELFEKAGRYIIDKEKASIGNLQRMFRIGFNRAARIMDQLADYGVVGPEEGTKARQILMNMEQFEELLKSL